MSNRSFSASFTTQKEDFETENITDDSHWDDI